MFKKLIIFVVLLLIWGPSVAQSSDKPVSKNVASPESTHVQSSVSTSNPTTNSSITPVPITTPPPISTVSPETIKFALTFDDGPNSIYTPQVLRILNKFGARATFFMVGQNFTRYSEIVKQVAESGNEIGAHSMTHPYPIYLSNSELDYEITASVTLLREMSGQPIRYFRTPYGEGNDVYTHRAAELGVKIVYWTVDPRDWSGISSDTIAEHVLDHLVPGCIVILHDGVDNSQATVDALENILHEATARGYKSVTLSELSI